VSQLVGSIVINIKATNPDIPSNIVASALALISGCIIVAIGLARCGWIVDLISLTAISAFMTGSALNIAVGQVPALMGLSGFSSRDSTYLVVINILSHLNSTTLDAAMGLTALAMLYLIRSACKLAAKRFPSQQKALFFVSTLRTVFVILLYTLISWLVNRKIAADSSSKAKFKILGTVPRGNAS
jgi:sodium-independent sulfate anion transporter 11